MTTIRGIDVNRDVKPRPIFANTKHLVRERERRRRQRSRVLLILFLVGLPITALVVFSLVVF